MSDDLELLRERLRGGKYTKWAAEFSLDELEVVLWLVGEYTCRAAPIEPPIDDKGREVVGGRKRRVVAHNLLLRCRHAPMLSLSEVKQRIRASIRPTLVLPAAREPVLWFAGKLEERLQANDHKGGWQDETFHYLWRRLIEELAEAMDEGLPDDRIRNYLFNQLIARIDGYDLHLPAISKVDVIKELADVGNFCLMIADKLRNGKGS